MEIATLLERLFPAGHAVRVDGDLVAGGASVDGRAISVVGTARGAAIGVELALALSGAILRTIREQPGAPLLLLVDTEGQRLRRRDELLGINACIAHLAQCVELARRRGHRSVSLVYGRAVSGGYIGAGMMADACYALAEAEISVMNLPAMARVTKIDLARLQELARTSPVFAPGADNYLAMGALDGIWHGDLAAALRAALAEAQGVARDGADRRRERGAERGGRLRALEVSVRVRRDPLS